MYSLIPFKAIFRHTWDEEERTPQPYMISLSDLLERTDDFYINGEINQTGALETFLTADIAATEFSKLVFYILDVFLILLLFASAFIPD